jgi:uncharacterized protein
MTLVLDDTRRRALLDIAAATIADALVTGTPRPVVPPDVDRQLLEPGASFVTLERGERLLGCIGALEPRDPLATDVAVHALQAAFADPRLPAITTDDYVAMSIKVSVLSPLEPLPVHGYADAVAAVRPFVDGLVVESGHHRGTLLPSVWPKVPDPGEFVAVLWQKAGLRPGTWPAGTTLARYTTEEFASDGPRAAPQTRFA